MRMNRLSMAALVLLCSLPAAVHADGALEAIQKNLAAHNAPDALTLYREHRKEKPVADWMDRQVAAGHPLFQMERANELLAQRKHEAMLPLWWRAHVGMMMDSSVCTSPNAAIVALQVGGNYAEVNKYLNNLGPDGVRRSLAILAQPWFSENPAPAHDPSWVCYLMENRGEAVRDRSAWTKQRGIAKMTVVSSTRMIFQSLK